MGFLMSDLINDSVGGCSLGDMAVVGTVHEWGDVGLIRVRGKRSQVKHLPMTPGCERRLRERHLELLFGF